MKTEESATTSAEEGTRAPDRATDKDDPGAFKTLTTVEELVLCHNEMVITAGELQLEAEAVETFPSMEEGQRDCDALFRRIQTRREEILAEKRRKKTSARAKKEKKVSTTAKKTRAPAKKAAKKTDNGAARGGGRSSLAEDAVINWKTGADNPAKKGSGRHERIELVRKFAGKTVAKFRAAGGRVSTLLRCQELGLASVKA